MRTYKSATLPSMVPQMRGGKLMELMIFVVVLIGIMAAIASYNYRQYVVRAQRAQAKNALLQIAEMQERFHLQNSTYTTDPIAKIAAT